MTCALGIFWLWPSGWLITNFPSQPSGEVNSVLSASEGDFVLKIRLGHEWAEGWKSSESKMQQRNALRSLQEARAVSYKARTSPLQFAWSPGIEHG